MRKETSFEKTFFFPRDGPITLSKSRGKKNIFTLQIQIFQKMFFVFF